MGASTWSRRAYFHLQKITLFFEFEQFVENTVKKATIDSGALSWKYPTEKHES